MESHEKIENELKKFSTIVEQSPTLIFTTNLLGEIEYVNPTFTQITGYSAQDVLGKNPRILKSGKHTSEFYQEFWGTIAAKKVWRGDFCNRTKDRREFWLASTVSPVLNAKGDVLFYVSIGEDITHKKWQNEMIEHMAMHDGLTGLPNRLLLVERLLQAIDEAKRENSQLAILYADVDQFKEINDSLGHEYGDSVLKIIGERLAANIRAMDTAARLGGDEFVVMIKNIQDKDQVRSAAQRILDAFSVPIKISNKDQVITLSMGISLYPEDAENSANLLRTADIAMYEAKKAGRNRFYFYHEHPQDINATMI